MKLTCALCGRPLHRPAFTIGPLSVGPKCGAKAGLAVLSEKKTGFVRTVPPLVGGVMPRFHTLDLFADLPA
jgi:hypothetical protein